MVGLSWILEAYLNFNDSGCFGYVWRPLSDEKIWPVYENLSAYSMRQWETKDLQLGPIARGWSSAKRCRSWVWARSLVLFLLTKMINCCKSACFSKLSNFHPSLYLYCAVMNLHAIMKWQLNSKLIRTYVHSQQESCSQDGRVKKMTQQEKRNKCHVWQVDKTRCMH